MSRLNTDLPSHAPVLIFNSIYLSNAFVFATAYLILSKFPTKSTTIDSKSTSEVVSNKHFISILFLFITLYLALVGVLFDKKAADHITVFELASNISILWFIMPFTEEMLFRSALWKIWENYFGKVVADFATAFFWLLGHCLVGFSVAIAIIPLAICLTLIKIRFDNTRYCIIFHCYNNILSSVVYFTFGYFKYGAIPKIIFG